MDEQQSHHHIQNQRTVQGQIGVNYGPVTMRFDGSSTIPVPPKQVWNIPHLRNDYFTGREEILEQLHARFKANNATALSQRHAMSGLGGIGKTQTAVEYAYRYHQDYQAVLWARAESHEALTSSFVEIAGLLDLSQKDEKNQMIIVQAVKRWLQDNRGWLLILDNADEPVIVREFLPTKCDGHILLTTRAQALGGLAQRIEVDTFTQELGALFLLRRATITADDGLNQATQSDREVAMQISDELGGLPLALDQAGAYIEQAQCSLSDYLSLYRTRRAEMLKERGYLVDGGPKPDYPETVATTWSISFQKVKQKNPAAAELLRFCAFLAPDAIPEEIITIGAEHLGSLLLTVARDPLVLNKAIAALGAYSLLRRDATEKTLSIHRLVQAVQRDAMSNEETKLWAERTMLAVNKACPNVEFEAWPQWEWYLPHALVCADLVERRSLLLPEAADLLNNTGGYLHERARYPETEQMYRHALAIREKLLGPEHPDTASSLNNLAELHRTQGKYELAEPLLICALAINEKALGPNHPNTATSLNNLAGLYDNQGKYDQAEPLYQRAITIWTQLLGLTAVRGSLDPIYETRRSVLILQRKGLNLLTNRCKHPHITYSLNNLADLYRAQGKYELAEPLLKLVLAIREKQLGPEHPLTATSLNNLALLYNNQGKYEPAELVSKRALAIREAQLGPEHPLTAASLNGLAASYQAEGKYELAEPLYQRALIIRERHLGHEHLDTANSLNNLALLYYNQGQYEQAKPLYVRALAIYKKALGSQHPDTRVVQKNYAVLLQAMGRDEEAK